MKKKKEEETAIGTAVQEQAVVAETVEQFNRQKAIDDISNGGSYLMDKDGNLTELKKEQ